MALERTRAIAFHRALVFCVVVARAAFKRSFSRYAPNNFPRSRDCYSPKLPGGAWEMLRVRSRNDEHFDGDRDKLLFVDDDGRDRASCIGPR